MRIEAHWPLYTVLPGTAAFFYIAYFFVWDRLLRKTVHVYAKLSPLEQSCLRANCNSLLHTYSIVILLCWALSSDPMLWSSRVQQHYNAIGYSAMCVTLAYFSLSVPWNVWQRFLMHEVSVVPLGIFVHHLFVVAAALLYVVTNVAAFYGAIAFVCMEFSNWFFIPRACAETLGWSNDGPLGAANGVCLVLSYLLLRIGVCTAAAILFMSDLSRVSLDGPAELGCALLALGIFGAVLALSYVWLRLQVLPGLRAAVGQLLVQRRLAHAQRRVPVALHAARQTQKADAAVQYLDQHPDPEAVEYHDPEAAAAVERAAQEQEQLRNALGGRASPYAVTSPQDDLGSRPKTKRTGSGRSARVAPLPVLADHTAISVSSATNPPWSPRNRARTSCDESNDFVDD